MSRSKSEASTLLQVAKKKKKEEEFLSPKALKKRLALSQPLYSPISSSVPKSAPAPGVTDGLAKGDTLFSAPQRNLSSTVQ